LPLFSSSLTHTLSSLPTNFPLSLRFSPRPLACSFGCFPLSFPRLAPTLALVASRIPRHSTVCFNPVNVLSSFPGSCHPPPGLTVLLLVVISAFALAQEVLSVPGHLSLVFCRSKTHHPLQQTGFQPRLPGDAPAPRINFCFQYFPHLLSRHLQPRRMAARDR
ncbi:hypothetical protein CCMA1212_000654, partial [Trichoderma ghanense]